MTKEQIIEKWVALLVPSKDITLINAYKKYLTEDLNSLSLPPAEGAVRHLTDDEIEKHGMEGGLRDGELQMYWEGATWYRSYAQKIADKMVSERCAKCKYRGLPDSINEALNSGDGVYRP